MSPPARPPAPQAVHPARAVLLELSSLLDAERAALTVLDREKIADYAVRKLELDQALTRAVAEVKLGAEDKELLAKVRQSALNNQLLLAHARS
jgi:hypothetical protein